MSRLDWRGLARPSLLSVVSEVSQCHDIDCPTVWLFVSSARSSKLRNRKPCFARRIADMQHASPAAPAHIGPRPPGRDREKNMLYLSQNHSPPTVGFIVTHRCKQNSQWDAPYIGKYIESVAGQERGHTSLQRFNFLERAPNSLHARGGGSTVLIKMHAG